MLQRSRASLWAGFCGALETAGRKPCALAVRWSGRFPACIFMPLCYRKQHIWPLSLHTPYHTAIPVREVY